jgi:hypothetical protein
MPFYCTAHGVLNMAVRILPLWGVIRGIPGIHSMAVYRALRPSRVEHPLISFFGY